MMDFITIPLVVGIITLGFYKLFELFARRRERILMVEKISEISACGSPLKLPSLDSYSVFKSSALKIGCLLIGLGLGLMVAFLICYSVIPGYLHDGGSWDRREVTGIVYGSSILLFGGIGLIIAFVIELKVGRKYDAS